MIATLDALRHPAARRRRMKRSWAGASAPGPRARRVQLADEALAPRAGRHRSRVRRRGARCGARPRATRPGRGGHVVRRWGARRSLATCFVPRSRRTGSRYGPTASLGEWQAAGRSRACLSASSTAVLAADNAGTSASIICERKPTSCARLVDWARPVHCRKMPAREFRSVPMLAPLVPLLPTSDWLWTRCHSPGGWRGCWHYEQQYVCRHGYGLVQLPMQQGERARVDARVSLRPGVLCFILSVVAGVHFGLRV